MSGLVPWLMNPIGNLFNLFNTKNDGGSTLWNHGQEYANPSFTEEGNKNAGNFGLDPNGYVSGLWNDVMGFTSQSREFAQQEYLQDKMNEYNLPVNQMKRLIDAGINPNLAASAVAGNGGESAQAPQVSSNTAGVAEGISKVAGTVASLGAGAASFADAAFKEGTLDVTISNLSADTKKKLVELGLSEAQIRGLDIDNMYKDSEWQKKLSLLDLEADNYSHQWDVLNSEWSLNMQKINESLKQMELADSQIGLNTANAQYLDMLKQKTELEKEWINIRVEFWKARGFDILTNSRDMAIVQMIENGKDIKPLLSSLREYEDSISYASKNAEQQAIKDNLFDIRNIEESFDNPSGLYGLFEHYRRMMSNWLHQKGIGFSNIRAVNKARRDMSELLEHLYDELDKPMTDSRRSAIQSTIDDLNSKLSLSKEEFVKWLESGDN